MSDELSRHLQAREGDRKRILALDGGGVRGLVSLGILARIEALLAARTEQPDKFRLCHYFDLIAGTSTGSVIAVALAMGKPVAEVVALYEKLCPPVFRREGRGLWKPIFGYRSLESHLKEIVGNAELQSDILKTGLMICAKRIDTGSAWVLTNNPRSKYWGSDSKAYKPNKEYELWRIVRASTAAPHYFDPVEVTINEEGIYPEQIGLFADGAVAGLTNPSVQALLTAILPAYGFNWPRGKDRLLMISVGTGWWRDEHDRKVFLGSATWKKTAISLAALIQDTSVHALTMMQALSSPRKPWRINSELGAMRGERLIEGELLTFQRFDAKFDLETVRRVCRISRPTDRRIAKLIDGLTELGNVRDKNMKYLYALGHDVGTVNSKGIDGIEPEDFPSDFDPPGLGAAAK
jgi:patatin-like phospholipase